MIHVSCFSGIEQNILYVDIIKENCTARQYWPVGQNSVECCIFDPNFISF